MYLLISKLSHHQQPMHILKRSESVQPDRFHGMALIILRRRRENGYLHSTNIEVSIYLQSASYLVDMPVASGKETCLCFVPTMRSQPEVLGPLPAAEVMVWYRSR